MQALLNVEVSGEPFELKGRMFLIGNGGSATIAQHIANDLIKAGRDAYSLTDPAVMSCIANDVAWEHVFATQVRCHVREGDILIAISSSGQSLNIVRAGDYALRGGAKVITLSGFSGDNLLRHLGHVNYYVPSSNYGVVEIAHLTILHAIVNPGV